MPRPIQLNPGTEGVTTYTLTAHDEWTINALTASFYAGFIAGTVSLIVDARSPAGGIIYRQLVAITDQSAFLALAFGAEAINNQGYSSGGGAFDTGGWPPGTFGVGINVVSESLPPLTLTPQCSLNIYAFAGYWDGTGDPLQTIDTGALINDPHLWVQDVASNPFGNLTVGNPILLGVGG